MTAQVFSYRLMEAVVMLPILHAPAGRLSVASVGPMSEQMAVEALRWREVEALYMLEPPKKLKDRRVKVVQKLPAAQMHVVLLSPEQSPAAWAKALAKDGIISPTTLSPDNIRKLGDDLRHTVGAVLPWREHLPQPLYGIMAKHTTERKIERRRNPPVNAQRLSKQYLPCLFTFGKDELSLAFSHRPARSTS